MMSVVKLLLILLLVALLIYLFGGRGSNRIKLGGQWQDVQRPSRFGEWYYRMVDNYFGDKEDNDNGHG